LGGDQGATWPTASRVTCDLAGTEFTVPTLMHSPQPLPGLTIALLAMMAYSDESKLSDLVGTP